MNQPCKWPIFLFKTMIQTILLTALSSQLTFIQPALTSRSSNPKVILTRVLPEENYVSYIVGKNDTLKSISLVYYGSEDHWIILSKDNPEISDPNNLIEGSLVKIRVETSILNQGLPLQESQKEKAIADQLQEPTAGASATPTVINTPELTIMPTAIPTSEDPTPSIAPTTAPIVSVTHAPLTNFDAVYQAAGAKYGIPWQILYGIHMTETGGRDGAISSGHGPEGPMQFMPGTFSAYAVDGDGDGNANIDNATDAIYTAAHFIAAHGSVMNGLHAYGGNTAGTLALAHARGFTQ
ncbi:MAG TPA: lytic murein transglycosylase [Candidatus Sulfotelmatobacter sp.]|jgi:hypothetical protein|nr:lytic murein transglycosylase [Candidatus Sulfotelmatobacter sp.]